MELTLFYIFSALMLLCGVLVLTSRDTVNSAMFLILSFLCMAGLYLLLHAVFIAAIQVLVYAGAVMVLFLFVIMLLNLQESGRRRARKLAAFTGVVVAASFAAVIARLLRTQGSVDAVANGAAPRTVSDVIKPLFEGHMLPFEIIGLIILTAVVGVVTISKRESR